MSAATAKTAVAMITPGIDSNAVAGLAFGMMICITGTATTELLAGSCGAESHPLPTAHHPAPNKPHNEVAGVESVVGEVDIFTSAPGIFDIVTLAHL